MAQHSEVLRVRVPVELREQFHRAVEAEQARDPELTAARKLRELIREYVRAQAEASSDD